MLTLHQWLIDRPHEAGEESNGPEFPSQFPCDWMFMASAEPVLIVEAGSGIIAEMNPPAAALLLSARAHLIGTPLARAFVDAGAAAIDGCITVAQAAGSAEIPCVRTREGGIDLQARFSLFRAPSGTFLLVRIAAADPGADGDGSCAESPVFEAVDRSPLGFLMTDRGFRIEYANRAFIDLLELSSPSDVCGSSLAKWLELTAEDLSALSAQLSRRQAVSVLTSWLRSARMHRRRVEICAVAVPDGLQTCWGFSIGELPRLH